MPQDRSTLVEKALGVSLPADYAAFLNEHGLMDVNGMEIYGYHEQLQTTEKIPCVIGATRLYRQLYNLQPHELVLAFSGYEDVLLVMDTRNGRVYEAGFTYRRQIATSFARWLQDLGGQTGEVKPSNQ